MKETNSGWMTRERALLIALSVATALTIYLCYLLLRPFLPILAWALAFAIITHPIHSWIRRKVPSENLAAGLATAVVAVMVIGPLIFVGQQLVSEATSAYRQFRGEDPSLNWREIVQRSAFFGSILDRVEQRVDLQEELERVGREIGARLPGAVTGSIRAGAGVLITLFTLFFFFRDKNQAQQLVRSLLPLSNDETNRLFRVVADTIYATLYGSVVVALVQGTLGGLMFWFLGLPAPLLWGFVMSVLAVIPMLGAFVIWLPAAIFLALAGSYVKAVVLVSYGALVIGLVDNFLYPKLVGRRLRLHVLPVFFALIGGVTLFGISGLVLGPVILAISIALLQVWKQRTTLGQSAEEPPKPSR